MTAEERYNHLREELVKLKEDKFRVFIKKYDPNIHDNFVYGVITDGTYIIYVEVSKYGMPLFTTAFEYVPSRETGSCCPAIEEGYGYKQLSKKVFDESVKEGLRRAHKYKATLYKDFEHYRESRWSQNNYVEL